MTTLKYAILDNDDSTAFLLSCILERIGQFSIEIFSSPKRLLNSVKLEKPDLIFCNVTTRDCDPRELLAAEINIPLIFISVLSPAEERRKCYIHSGFPYITSPLRVDTIASYL